MREHPELTPDRIGEMVARAHRAHIDTVFADVFADLVASAAPATAPAPEPVPAPDAEAAADEAPSAIILDSTEDGDDEVDTSILLDPSEDGDDDESDQRDLVVRHDDTEVRSDIVLGPAWAARYGPSLVALATQLAEQPDTARAPAPTEANQGDLVVRYDDTSCTERRR